MLVTQSPSSLIGSSPPPLSTSTITTTTTVPRIINQHPFKKRKTSMDGKEIKTMSSPLPTVPGTGATTPGKQSMYKWTNSSFSIDAIMNNSGSKIISGNEKDTGKGVGHKVLPPSQSTFFGRIPPTVSTVTSNPYNFHHHTHPSPLASAFLTTTGHGTFLKHTAIPTFDTLIPFPLSLYHPLSLSSVSVSMTSTSLFLFLFLSLEEKKPG